MIKFETLLRRLQQSSAFVGIKDVFKGSTGTIAGAAGVVPAPPIGTGRFLADDATWKKPVPTYLLLTEGTNLNTLTVPGYHSFAPFSVTNAPPSPGASAILEVFIVEGAIAQRAYDNLNNWFWRSSSDGGSSWTSWAFVQAPATVASVSATRTMTDNTVFVSPKGIADAMAWPAAVAVAAGSTYTFNGNAGPNQRITLPTSGAVTLGQPTLANLRPGVTYALWMDNPGSATVAFNTFFDFGPDGAPTVGVKVAVNPVFGVLYFQVMHTGATVPKALATWKQGVAQPGYSAP